MELLTYYIVGAFAVGAITFTTSQSGIFKEVRDWMGRLHPKIDDLIHCPWCSSFWGSVIFMFIAMFLADLPLFIISSYTWFNILVILFAFHAVTGFVHYILILAYAPIAKNEMARKQRRQQELAARIGSSVHHEDSEIQIAKGKRNLKFPEVKTGVEKKRLYNSLNR